MGEEVPDGCIEPWRRLDLLIEADDAAFHGSHDLCHGRHRFGQRCDIPQATLCDALGVCVSDCPTAVRDPCVPFGERAPFDADLKQLTEAVLDGALLRHERTKERRAGAPEGASSRARQPLHGSAKLPGRLQIVLIRICCVCHMGLVSPRTHFLQKNFFIK